MGGYSPSGLLEASYAREGRFWALIHQLWLKDMHARGADAAFIAKVEKDQEEGHIGKTAQQPLQLRVSHISL